MVVLITGVTGGFGGVLGDLLAREGMTVYGTSRNPDSASGFDYPILKMEITDSESVNACVNEVVEREGRLDVVVNCINDMMIGRIEEETIDELKTLYDTNVFGAVRLFQAVVPVMRKQGSGQIIMMSSAGGIFAIPNMSAYTSAKFALEANTEALHHELRGENIDIVIMQPVAMYMERGDTGKHLHLVKNVPEGSPSLRMVSRMSKDTAASKLTPEIVSKKVLDIIRKKKKPLRVPMDKAKPFTLIRKLAPQSFVDKLMAGLA